MANQAKQPVPTPEPNFFEPLAELNVITVGIWFCGIAFCRFSTGIWLGDRPAMVFATIFSLVFIHMHWGKWLLLTKRLLIIAILFYLAHVHLVQPGDFYLIKPGAFGWRNLLAFWVAANISFLVSGNPNSYLSIGRIFLSPKTTHGKVVFFPFNKNVFLFLQICVKLNL